MTSKLTPPAVPEDAVDSDWTLVDERTETVFELPTLQVRGVTRRFEDERSVAALAEAGYDVEHPVRFFAVSRLVFEPPLPPGIGTSMIAPTVRTEARKAFERRLRERGLADVSRDRSERFRLPDRTRVRLWRHTARLPSGELETDLPLECWVGVWMRDDEVFVVTGGHPTVTLASHLPEAVSSGPLTRSPDEYRDEFLELLRETGKRN
jgi:hypothetical protein